MTYRILSGGTPNAGPAASPKAIAGTVGERRARRERRSNVGKLRLAIGSQMQRGPTTQPQQGSTSGLRI